MEEIAKLLCPSVVGMDGECLWEPCPDDTCEVAPKVNQILSLIGPLIEEAKQEGIKKGYASGLVDGQYTNHKRHGKKMIQARQEGAKMVVEWIENKAIYVADRPPVENRPYMALGSYILKWGKELEPSYGFRDLREDEIWQQFLKEKGLE